jgi:hypothetical protein
MYLATLFSIWAASHGKHDNIALVNIEPLGNIICGINAQDRIAISRCSSHQILTQAVRYFARLRYACTIRVQREEAKTDTTNPQDELLISVAVADTCIT